MIGPNEFLEVLSVVIQEQMDTDAFLPPFRPEDVHLIGRYSRTPAEEKPQLHGEPEALALVLYMADGAV